LDAQLVLGQGEAQASTANEQMQTMMLVLGCTAGTWANVDWKCSWYLGKCANVDKASSAATTTTTTTATTATPATAAATATTATATATTATTATTTTRTRTRTRTKTKQKQNKTTTGCYLQAVNTSNSQHSLAKNDVE
jgi:hypothetical protein